MGSSFNTVFSYPSMEVRWVVWCLCGKVPRPRSPDMYILCRWGPHKSSCKNMCISVSIYGAKVNRMGSLWERIQAQVSGYKWMGSPHIVCFCIHLWMCSELDGVFVVMYPGPRESLVPELTLGIPHSDYLSPRHGKFDKRQRRQIRCGKYATQ